MCIAPRVAAGRRARSQINDDRSGRGGVIDRVVIAAAEDPVGPSRAAEGVGTERTGHLLGALTARQRRSRRYRQIGTRAVGDGDHEAVRNRKRGRLARSRHVGCGDHDSQALPGQIARWGAGEGAVDRIEGEPRRPRRPARQRHAEGHPVAEITVVEGSGGNSIDARRRGRGIGRQLFGVVPYQVFHRRLAQPGAAVGIDSQRDPHIGKLEEFDLRDRVDAVVAVGGVVVGDGRAVVGVIGEAAREHRGVLTRSAPEGVVAEPAGEQVVCGVASQCVGE